MAYDAFLKLEGDDIAGESTAKGHAGEIEIYSFSWGASNPVTIGSGSTGISGGKVSISSFNIMKKTEKSSPPLFAACCQGKHINTATVTLRKATGSQEPYLTYVFTNVMVESIQWSGSTGGDETPTESVSFAFASVAITYQQQDTKGGGVGKPVNASWDQTTVSKGD